MVAIFGGILFFFCFVIGAIMLAFLAIKGIISILTS